LASRVSAAGDSPMAQTRATDTKRSLEIVFICDLAIKASMTPHTLD
jgi:hypothetical protein